KKAAPLTYYLDKKNEENALKYSVFMNILKNAKITKIRELEEEQEKISKEIPFKVKFASNYMWQIYYSRSNDKYFMLVPTEETENEAFLYLLKKKIENKKNSSIFVPVSGVDYSSEYLKRSEIQNLENYMWLFTKNWPLIYEVYDKNNNLSLQIIGETNVYEKLKSWYKIKLENKEQANSFYKLLKAMFILQTDLPSYFSFDTGINNYGEIVFYKDGNIIEQSNLVGWITNEYQKCNERILITNQKIMEGEVKLNNYKQEAVLLENEYLEKEKQISTFLECKKSFLGKVKYFFKFSKGKKVKDKKQQIEIKEQEEEKHEVNDDTIIVEDIKKIENCTLEELIENYKKLKDKEEKLSNIKMDINALKLKNKNLNKKIENASIYIKEIDSHKKSIFEFWKYSNKDVVEALPEGEEEEVNVVKKIEKYFDYEEDLENFGKKYDKELRRKLSQDETDAIFITNTKVIDILNKIKTNELLPKDLDSNLKLLKKEAIEENVEFDIFGRTEDNTKVSKIKNKKHREIEKDMFNILEINKNAKPLGYKLVLEQITNKINSAIEKVKIEEEIPVYKLICDEELDKDLLNVFNINPVNEIIENINNKGKTINLYKLNIKDALNGIPFTNIVFYNNQNQTLPAGMDLSTKALIDISQKTLENERKSDFNIVNFEDEKDEFSKIQIKNVNVIEFDII
ncbi:MAG: hypothetical protein IKF44_00550, partial [Mycoplasmataceae bacterium]|nr:hypothetical protein [Mycoplasmataceae bacterium]